MIFPRRGVLAEVYEEIFGIRRYGACVRAVLGGRGFNLRGVFRLRRKKPPHHRRRRDKKDGGVCAYGGFFFSSQRRFRRRKRLCAYAAVSLRKFPAREFFAKYKHLFDFFLSARYTMNKCLKMRGNAR